LFSVTVLLRFSCTYTNAVHNAYLIVTFSFRRKTVKPRRQFSSLDFRVYPFSISYQHSIINHVRMYEDSGTIICMKLEQHRLTKIHICMLESTAGRITARIKTEDNSEVWISYNLKQKSFDNTKSAFKTEQNNSRRFNKTNIFSRDSLLNSPSCNSSQSTSHQTFITTIIINCC